MVTDVFLNHAHNDYLEIWFECGWLGLALIAAFMGWWVLATTRVLRSPADANAGLALCGSVIVALLLIHSAADYPLRTPALAALFAFAAGLLSKPPPTPAKRL
jgi:O-antigen ligase